MLAESACQPSGSLTWIKATGGRWSNDPRQTTARIGSPPMTNAKPAQQRDLINSSPARAAAPTIGAT